jgi:hypothetical protein
MRQGLGQVQERAPGSVAAERGVPTGMLPVTREIPYDYVARFQFEGRPGNRVEDVINVSVEGAFVAVSIGYSFIPARLPAPILDQADRDRILSSWVNNDSLRAVNLSAATSAAATLTLDVLQPLLDPRILLQALLFRLHGVHFKYSIIDSSTGRELQNRPIHNIAGLGEPMGVRPFRPFAKPILFMPRSTIRIEVEELEEGPVYGYTNGGRRVGGELYIVLHGYKILGYGTGQP